MSWLGCVVIFMSGVFTGITLMCVVSCHRLEEYDV